MDDYQAEQDTVFMALTRNTLAFGVPIEYFALLGMSFGVGMILVSGLKNIIIMTVCVILPLYGLGRYLTEKDTFWISVILKKLTHCAPTMNKKFWGSNSYMP